MQRFILFPIWMALCAGLPCCASGRVTINVDGIDIHEKQWNETTQELGARLRFEHNCDGPYEFVLIKKEYYHPTEVGVAACNRKWVFSRTLKNMKPGDWQARQTASNEPLRWYPKDSSDTDTKGSDEPAGVGTNAVTQNEMDTAAPESDTGATDETAPPADTEPAPFPPNDSDSVAVDEQPYDPAAGSHQGNRKNEMFSK
ncbi:MAG: hypothetical protein JXR76_04190, partial [Deltaproteobacteria bacterium]|nr:hypothetical protein [Deltaproteobacteria bacterium]